MPINLVVVTLVAALSGHVEGVLSISSNSANPIRKVVTLLQKMSKKIESEGAEEKVLYDKFSCYCRTNSGDLATSIAESTAKVPQVQSDIESSESQLQRLKGELQSHQEDRAGGNTALAEAKSLRESQRKAYEATSSQYKSYIEALKGAISALQKGMAGGFLQIGNNAPLLTRAVVDATKLTEYDKKMVLSFLSGGAKSSETYTPGSGEIVGILQQIQADFEATLRDVEASEAEAVKLDQELVSAKTKQVATMTGAIEMKTVRVGELEVEIVNLKRELTDEEASLVADQKFAADLQQNCDARAADWQERQKTRMEELQAISEVITVLNDDDSLELFKKTLPSTSLLQTLAGPQREAQSQAMEIVRGSRKANAVGLEFLALALTGKQVDFSNVIKMIDKMVTILAQEQADDDQKKEYCEKQIDLAEDNANALAQKVHDLEITIESQDGLIAALASDLKTLAARVAELDKSVADATQNRKKEHDEYIELMSSNKAAKDLLAFAKNRLNKFYSPNLYTTTSPPVLSEEDRIATNFGLTMPPTPAPGGIAGTGISVGGTFLVQITLHKQQRDAPAPPPATWSNYSKRTQETTGVIAMIDLLVKDLDKEMTEADVGEKNAQKQYERVMVEAAASRAADISTIATKESAKAEAESAKSSASQARTAEVKELIATKEYESQLHAECDWLIQNFDLRKEARANEAESLKQAKAVLAGADFSFTQRSLRGKN